MIEAVLVVLTKAVPGLESDMDDWYTNIHIRDALRFRGSVTAQRFRWSASQPAPPPDFDWQYLALYDVFDPQRFSSEHWENALTSRMKVTEAIDDSVLYDYHYYPLNFVDRDPAVAHAEGVILEQLRPVDGREAEFREWYGAEYLSQAMRRPGVKSGAFLMYRPEGQMIPSRPDHRYIGIYRVSGPDAVDAWRGAPATLFNSGLLTEGGAVLTHWDRVTDRITKDAVQHPTAAALAEEERARAHMGDRVKTGGADKLGAA
ncbi:hypothetical protein HZF05_05980 [Sphingomonas sp. CGMCC 1.13654]|uniref:EthD domain-containing protein n=1 Tax=Sphingomonas chungangi TaxID=2683589 RepID=A0A838L2B6_9SPHN|nr:hypothetical protein [Sphingomonas chungangi]MBA2933643.1 hypothetical protein [Sphingomonas chungangi]MVW54975.1 hypothetical protein [Sphingomonas chungangi]